MVPSPTTEGEEILGFVPQSPESIQRQAREELREPVVKGIAPEFYGGYRRGTNVLPPGDEMDMIHNPLLRYAFSSLTAYATHIDLSQLEEAGFHDRKAFYREALNWVGEAWTEAGYGLENMTMIKADSPEAAKLKANFDHDVKVTQRKLTAISENWAIYSAPPGRDEELERKLDEKFGPLQLQSTKAVWPE